MRIGGVLAWNFVQKQLWTGVGSFVFTADENYLKQCLERDKNFADPDFQGNPQLQGKACTIQPKWDSRELCAKASVHFRGESKGEIAVHIDPDGLATGPGLLGKLHPSQWLEHWYTYRQKRWSHVESIRAMLIAQGYPKEILQVR
jgi:hypothetical protein